MLDPDRCYLATIYRDGEGAHWETRPFGHVVKTRTVTASETFNLWLASGGRAAVRFVHQR